MTGRRVAVRRAVEASEASDELDRLIHGESNGNGSTDGHDRITWTADEKELIVCWIAEKYVTKIFQPLGRLLLKAQDEVLPEHRRRSNLQPAACEPWLKRDIRARIKSFEMKVRNHEKTKATNDRLKDEISKLQQKVENLESLTQPTLADVAARSISRDIVPILLPKLVEELVRGIPTFAETLTERLSAIELAVYTSNSNVIEVLQSDRKHKTPKQPK